MRAFVLALVLFVAPSIARATTRHLAASLFGETVGEVRLTLSGSALSYRSELHVVRGRVRLRETAFIEARFDPKTGALLRSTAQRCRGPDVPHARLACSRPIRRGPSDAVPAIAAETFLAREPGGKRSCLHVIDEQSGETGDECATVTRAADGSMTLIGTKLGHPFRARVVAGLLSSLTLPDEGAHFVATTGPIEVSDDDLFAAPIPFRGNPAAALRRGELRLKVVAPPEALARLARVRAPGQTVVTRDAGALAVDLHQVALPQSRRVRRLLTRVAFVLARARDPHIDCQTATAAFLETARRHRWNARRAIGIAFVDGRFAFHEWAILETASGAIPVDPLLAQVPADAGHLQLSGDDGSVGDLLVTFRDGLSLVVE